MMKKFAIFNIIAIIMLLITISSALATVLNTNIDVTSIDKYDYDTLIITASDSGYNAPLLRYKISTNGYIDYSTLYDASKMSYIQNAVYPYYPHTYIYDSNTNTELFFSPSNDTQYYKKVSSNPNNWVNYALPLPQYYGLPNKFSGMEKFDTQTPIISLYEINGTGLCSGFVCLGTYYYLFNYDISLFLDLSSYASSGYNTFTGQIKTFQHYYETATTPLIMRNNQLHKYEFYGNSTYLSGTSFADIKKGIYNGNLSQLIVLRSTVPTIQIFKRYNATAYLLQNLTDTCSQIFNTPYQINDVACANDNDCMFVGNLSSTSIMISYISGECALLNVSGNGLNTILYNQNSYYENYFYGGDNIFGTTANIQLETVTNISIPRPDGFAYNLYSPDQCLYDSSTRTSYLCINSQYDNNTKTFYCPTADSVVNCTYGCVNIMNDMTTGGIKFYYLDRTCSDTPISFSCIANDILFFLIPNPALWHLCNPLTQTAGLDSSYCENTNIKDTITANPSKSFYTGGTCIAGEQNYTCTLGQSRCLGYYNIQTCQVNTNGYNFWNNTESCTLGFICSTGTCIVQPVECSGLDCPINATGTDTSVLNFINNLLGTSGNSSGSKALVAFLVTIVAVILTIIIFSATGLIEMAGLFAIFETIIFTVLFALLGFYPLWLTIVFAILAAVAVVLFVKAIFING